MTENAFEILHFSYREFPSFRENGCYKINLVFRAWGSYVKSRFLTEADDWIERRVVKDKELAEKYTKGLRMVNADTGKDLLEDWKECEENDMESSIPVAFVSDSGIKSEDVYFTAYEKNLTNMLTYNEKFDVFRFYEYFEINSITDGIIQHIKNLKSLDNKDEYHAEQLLRAIKSLEFWWD